MGENDTSTAHKSPQILLVLVFLATLKGGGPFDFLSFKDFESLDL